MAGVLIAVHAAGVRGALVALAQHAGLQVEEAPNAVEALVSLEMMGDMGAFDVLLDPWFLVEPVGEQLFPRARELGAQRCLLVTSAFREGRYRNRGRSRGEDAVVDVRDLRAMHDAMRALAGASSGGAGAQAAAGSLDDVQLEAVLNGLADDVYEGELELEAAQVMWRAAVERLGAREVSEDVAAQRVLDAIKAACAPDASVTAELPTVDEEPAT